MPNDVAPDPLANQLARFSPVPMDQAQLLFEAGRASAPSTRRWKWLAEGLIVSHLGWVCGIWAYWPKTPEKPILSDPQSLHILDNTEPSTNEASPLPSHSYIVLRNQWLKNGEIMSPTEMSSEPATLKTEPLKAGLSNFNLD